MPKRPRTLKNRRGDVESWIRWELNPFSLLDSFSPVPAGPLSDERTAPNPKDPWSRKSAVEFYLRNRGEIHRAAEEQGATNRLEEWQHIWQHHIKGREVEQSTR